MSEEKIEICPFLSSFPHFVGCSNGTIMILPGKIKCEFKCSAWENDRCIRLVSLNKLEGNKCTCGGNTDV